MLACAPCKMPGKKRAKRYAVHIKKAIVVPVTVNIRFPRPKVWLSLGVQGKAAGGEARKREQVRC